MEIRQIIKHKKNHVRRRQKKTKKYKERRISIRITARTRTKNRARARTRTRTRTLRARRNATPQQIKKRRMQTIASRAKPTDPTIG